MKPLATVIIPTYNYGKFIGDAIESVLNSEFSRQELEIIVIDDGSTDDTPEKIQPYKDRIQYIYQDNHGKAHATKVGIDLAAGEYLFNLDADDIFLPNKLRRVVSIFESNSDIVHVSHPAICWHVNSDKKVVEAIPRDVSNSVIHGQKLLHFFYRSAIFFGGGSTFSARTAVLKQIMIPREIDMYIDEYLVLATLGNKYSFFINEPLSIWRIHGSNFSEAKTFDKSKIDRKIASIEAVVEHLSHLQLDDEVEELYRFKLQVSMLALKEQIGTKSLKEILELLWMLGKLLPFVGMGILPIATNYFVINRLLPASYIRLLKSFQNRFRGSSTFNR